MSTCDVCGNDYDKAFQVIKEGETHTFDSLECAAQVIAPRCAHCGTRILGHGLENDSGVIFCCDHCARQEGEERFRDRA